MLQVLVDSNIKPFLGCNVQYMTHYSVAYAENFHGGASFSDIWWSFVFGVRCL